MEDIYAIGDCVEVKSHITGTPALSPAGTTAVRKVMVLSNNMLGNKLTFDPVVNTVVSKVGNYNYACSGITESFANMIGMPVVSACLETCQKARYYPQNNMLYIKMICKPDGTIVGCQMLSEGDLSSRIDVLSFILTDNMNCDYPKISFNGIIQKLIYQLFPCPDFLLQFQLICLGNNLFEFRKGLLHILLQDLF